MRPEDDTPPYPIDVEDDSSLVNEPRYDIETTDIETTTQSLTKSESLSILQERIKNAMKITASPINEYQNHIFKLAKPLKSSKPESNIIGIIAEDISNQNDKMSKPINYDQHISRKEDPDEGEDLLEKNFLAPLHESSCGDKGAPFPVSMSLIV